MKFGENLPPTTPSWFPQVRRAEPAPSWHPEAPQDAPVPSCPCPPLHLGDTIGTRLLCNTFFSWKGGTPASPRRGRDHHPADKWHRGWPAPLPLRGQPSLQDLVLLALNYPAWDGSFLRLIPRTPLASPPGAEDAPLVPCAAGVEEAALQGAVWAEAEPCGASFSTSSPPAHGKTWPQRRTAVSWHPGGGVGGLVWGRGAAAGGGRWWEGMWGDGSQQLRLGGRGPASLQLVPARPGEGCWGLPPGDRRPLQGPEGDFSGRHRP